MDERPHGTTTLLFSDIEESTRIVQRLGAGFAGVLEDQRRLLRAAFAAHGGIEVDVQGDGFFVVFQHASDAVAAAAEAQRALADHHWPDQATIRVRMGLHTGEPTATPEGYVGIDVHRAARICAAGHGGQVLLSRETCDAVAHVLPPGVAIRDLGEHWLKDLPQAQQLFQLVLPELPSTFPPVRALEGMDVHFNAVMKSISDGRLVIMLGAGANLCGRPRGSTWEMSPPGTHVPTDAELAARLATMFNYPRPSPRELARVSQYAAATAGTGPLYEEIRAALNVDFAPTPLHHLLASLPTCLRESGYAARYQFIITTNYDDALECAFRAAGEPFDLLIYIAEGDQRGKFWHVPPDGRARFIDRPNKYLGLSLEQRTVIMKVHGAVDRADAERDSFVVTEDDYFDYLTQGDLSNLIPVTLAAKLRRSHLLFLGYDSRAWNYRMLLHRLLGGGKLKYKSWAVQAGSDPIDYQHWRQRDIDVLEMGLDGYIVQLAERIRSFSEDDHDLLLPRSS